MKTIAIDELLRKKSEIDEIKLEMEDSRVIKFSSKEIENSRLIDKLYCERGLFVFNFPSELMYEYTLRHFIRLKEHPWGFYNGPVKYRFIHFDPDLTFKQCSIIAAINGEEHTVIDNTFEDKDRFEIFDCHDRLLLIKFKPIESN